MPAPPYPALLPPSHMPTALACPCAAPPPPYHACSWLFRASTPRTPLPVPAPPLPFPQCPRMIALASRVPAPHFHCRSTSAHSRFASRFFHHPLLRSHQPRASVTPHPTLLATMSPSRALRRSLEPCGALTLPFRTPLVTPYLLSSPHTSTHAPSSGPVHPHTVLPPCMISKWWVRTFLRTPQRHRHAFRWRHLVARSPVLLICIT
ncbi:hypothetical protein DENSPDRAFT_887301 [Dentipellis sp. KUC8613]|nr:hypothetical protein DENSPDRAFT_887204 [Dentipellis sp. KUC8613]KAA1480030.1 hypothetical protein DENSPDRAFT_887301 [Dentipellis sp. KUC8613]